MGNGTVSSCVQTIGLVGPKGMAKALTPSTFQLAVPPQLHSTPANVPVVTVPSTLPLPAVLAGPIVHRAQSRDELTLPDDVGKAIGHETSLEQASVARHDRDATAHTLASFHESDDCSRAAGGADERRMGRGIRRSCGDVGAAAPRGPAFSEKALIAPKLRRMKRYAAFLRGVSPMNAKMPELKRAFEAAGFKDVRTLLSSGNVVFSAAASSGPALERRAEAAMKKTLGTAFGTFIRSVDALRALLDSAPHEAFGLDAKAKRIVTFLREPPARTIRLPIELDGARILLVKDTEVLSAYVPGTRGPVFMTLIEKTFGKDVTTRTWQTVTKAAT